MRLSKEDRDLVRTRGLKGLFEILKREQDYELVKLRKLNKIKEITRSQGKLEIIESLLKLDS